MHTFRHACAIKPRLESLPVKCLSNSYLKECLILGVSINNKRGYVVSLYRSPSQTSDELDSFMTNLEKIVVDIRVIRIFYY